MFAVKILQNEKFKIVKNILYLSIRTKYKHNKIKNNLKISLKNYICENITKL